MTDQPQEFLAVAAAPLRSAFSAASPLPPPQFRPCPRAPRHCGKPLDSPITNRLSTRHDHTDHAHRLQSHPLVSRPCAAPDRSELRTSSARAPPRLTIKFACSIRKSRAAHCAPLSPAPSSSRPAKSPGGFLKMEPAFGSPLGWRAARLAFNPLTRARKASTIPTLQFENPLA